MDIPNCKERSFCLVLVAVALLWPACASANTLYVNSASGNDRAAGTPTRPFKTIGKAILASTDAVTVIVLAAGTYSASTGESFGWTFRAHGTTTILAAPNQQVVIDAGGGPSTTLEVGDAGIAAFADLTLRNAAVVLGASSFDTNNSVLENFHASLRSDSLMHLADVDVRGSSAFDVQNGSTLYLTRVDADGSGSAVDTFVRVIAGGRVLADEFVVHDMVVRDTVIDAIDGEIQLNNSSVVDSWGTSWETNSFLERAVTVRATGADARLFSIDSSISGSAGIAIFGDLGSTVKIEGGAYTGNLIGVYSMGRSYLNNTSGFASTALFRNTEANWRVSGPEAFALLDDVEFRGGTFGVQSYDNARIMVSNSMFRGVSRPIQFESIDATQNSAVVGTNLLFLGGASNYSSVVAKCAGSSPVNLMVTESTWRPGVQGSDADGHFTPQTFSGFNKGSNFWLKSANCRLLVH